MLFTQYLGSIIPKVTYQHHVPKSVKDNSKFIGGRRHNIHQEETEKSFQVGIKQLSFVV